MISKEEIHRLLAVRHYGESSKESLKNIRSTKKLNHWLKTHPDTDVSDLINTIEENYNVESNAIKINKPIELDICCMKITPEDYIAMTHGYCVENNQRVRSPIYITDGSPRCHIRKSVYTDETRNNHFLLTSGIKANGLPGRHQKGNWYILNQWYNEGLCKIGKSPRFMTVNSNTFVHGSTDSTNIIDYWRGFNYGRFGYAIHVDNVYHIKEDKIIQKNVFKELCSNGLFNQWNFEAPCNRLKDVDDNPKTKPEILFCRVYKINAEIYRDDLVTWDAYDHSRYWDEFHRIDQRDVVISHPVISDANFEEMRTKLESVLNKYGALE